jgi:hypothetical protein
VLVDHEHTCSVSLDVMHRYVWMLYDTLLCIYLAAVLCTLLSSSSTRTITVATNCTRSNSSSVCLRSLSKTDNSRHNANK